MKRLFSFVLLLLLVFSTVLTSCTEEKPDEGHPDYTYSNRDPIPSDIHDFTNADGMTVDGRRDAQYGTVAAHRLYHKNIEGSDVYLDAYLYFGEEGIHCFVSVHDNILSWNGNRAVYLNSSVELFFNAAAKGGAQKLSIDNKTCQWRIDCGGKSTKLCGVGGKSTYTSSYFDGQFAVGLRGKLNSQDAEGFDVETFIPWYELGFAPDENGKYNVDTLMFNVAYNHKDDPYGAEDNTTRARTMKTLSFQATPYTWVPLGRNDDGTARDLTSADGDFFGTLVYDVGALRGIYKPSYLFDLSSDNAAGGNRATLSSLSPTAYALVKNSGGTHLYYEAYISGINGNKSSNPKIGITLLFPTNRVTLYVKMYDNGEATDGHCGVVQRDLTNSSYVWTVGAENGPYTNADFLDDNSHFITEGVRLAIYRNEDILCFFVNDILYFANQAAIDAGFRPLHEEAVVLRDTQSREIYGTKIVDPSIAGVFSFSAGATFSDYRYLTGAEADARVGALLSASPS